MILYTIILYHIWWVHKPAPGPAFWPGFIPLQHDHYCTAHYPRHAALYGSISVFLLRAASKYDAMLSGHSAFPFRCSLRCGPGFEFGLKCFTNQVKNQHSRRHQRRLWCLLPRCRRRLPRESPRCTVGRCRRHKYPAHANKIVRNNKVQKFDSNFKTKQTENK